MRAHADEHGEDSRAGFVQPDVLHEQMTAGLRGRRDEPECRAGDIPGDVKIARFGRFFSDHGNRQIVHVRPDEEPFQHPLGVIAALARFGDAGAPVREQPGEKHRAFDLRAGHRRGVMDRGELASFDHQRGRVFRAFGLEFCAHLGERIDHALHRAAGKGRVADEPGAERLCSQNPREEPHRGAGVAAVDVALGGG